MKLEIRPATEHVPSFSPQEFQTYLSASCFHRYVTLSLPEFSEPIRQGYKTEWENEDDHKRRVPLWCWH